MSQFNAGAGARRNPAALATNLGRLLNDVAFHANVIALRATVNAVRADRQRPTRSSSSNAAIEPKTIKLVGELDQAAAALDDAVQKLRTAVQKIESLAQGAIGVK